MIITRTERGWVGHYIMGERCHFRRNTLLDDGTTRIVISTVGAMRNKENKYDTVGCDRYFETMAFHASFDDPYWDADVSRQVYFESPWCIDHIDHGADKEANDMHEAVVEKIAKTMFGAEPK